jgi:histidinol-phosphate phosphatase family protein
VTAVHAAIVAEGLETGAATLTGDRLPKALLPVAGVPIIVRQMRILGREGVVRVSVLAGHLGEQLKPVLEAEAAALNLRLDLLIEPTPLEAAGRLAELAPSADETLIVYGDMLFDIELTPLLEYHHGRQALLTVVARPNDHPRSSDVIVESDGWVRAILPRDKPRAHDARNLVPAGLYLASPAFFADLQPGVQVDMIHDVLPRLITSGARIAAYNTPEYLRDIGTPSRHALAERDLTSGRVEASRLIHQRPAVFLDCDGVLNQEPGGPGIVTPGQVKAIPGAGAAVRCAREAGFLTVAVTNRPQVARGMITFEELDHILGRLEALLAEDGGVLDRIYSCPHHPESGVAGEVSALKIPCECRKPGTLMLRQAVADLPIDKSRSMLVGDSLRDIGAARGIGIWAYGVRTGYGCRDRARYHLGPPPAPDLMFENVSEAIAFGIGYRRLAAAVLDQIRVLIGQVRKPVLVALCGRSRAGKTVLAHAVARSLIEDQVPCLCVRLDNWIMPVAERGPRTSAEVRNRVEVLPAVIAAMRAGESLRAPGYDAATGRATEAVTYEPADRSVILIEGGFAAHETVRSMLDLALFVDVPQDLQRERFAAFYRWKGLDPHAIDALWDERARDEWPAVDLQRASADRVLEATIEPRT